MVIIVPGQPSTPKFAILKVNFLCCLSFAVSPTAGLCRVVCPSSQEISGHGCGCGSLRLSSSVAGAWIDDDACSSPELRRCRYILPLPVVLHPSSSSFLLSSLGGLPESGRPWCQARQTAITDLLHPSRMSGRRRGIRMTEGAGLGTAASPFSVLFSGRRNIGCRGLHFIEGTAWPPMR